MQHGTPPYETRRPARVDEHDLLDTETGLQSRCDRIASGQPMTVRKSTAVTERQPDR